MFTDVQIVNSGLAKIGSSRVNQIAPPTTSLERVVASGYQLWKKTEIAKRRWAFAMVYDYTLTLTSTIDGAERPYVYSLPGDCLRPVRGKYSEWVQRGRFLHSSYSTLKLEYIADVAEDTFDPLFVEVLACRVAMECCEPVTQSNTKQEWAAAKYAEALTEAARSNAFVTGPEDLQQDDNDFPFLTSRY